MDYTDVSNEHEKETIRLLKNLGFSHINGGPEFKVGGRQVDACGGHENTLLVLECTTQKDITQKIDNFRGKSNEIISGFKTTEPFNKYENHKLILAVKGKEITELNRKHAEEKTPKIHLWDDAYVSYYMTLSSSINEHAKYSLLTELDVGPETKSVTTIPAFSTLVGKEGKYRLFIFYIRASELLKISYVARREAGGETFYQRMLKKARLRKIASYINKGKCFPNSIVLALDKDSWSFREHDLSDAPDWVSFGFLTLGNSYDSCWVIDGQHRLFSHTQTSVNGTLVVSAFANISQEAQAEYFVDINREAKRVDANLLWDLLGSISPKSKDGVISNSVKRLRKMRGGFFYSNIRIPSLGKGRFSFNSLCVSLEKNELGEKEIGHKFKKRRSPFYSDDNDRFITNLSNGVNGYFVILDDGLHESVKKNLYTDGFVSVLIALYKLLIVHTRKRPTKAECEKMLEVIWGYLNTRSDDDLVNIRNSLSSEGGRTYFRNDLINLLQASYNPNFAAGLIDASKTLADKIQDLEFDLNRYVNGVLYKEVGEDWLDAYIRDGKQLKTLKAKSKRHDKPPWEFLNFLTTINAVVLNDTLWEDIFRTPFSDQGFRSKDEIRVLASKIWDYRSNKIHPRSGPVVITRQEEELIEDIYKMFLNVVSEA